MAQGLDGSSDPRIGSGVPNHPLGVICLLWLESGKLCVTVRGAHGAGEKSGKLLELVLFEIEFGLGFASGFSVFMMWGSGWV